MRAIAANINSYASDQIFFLEFGLSVFGLWLTIYLLWWVFWFAPKDETTPQEGGK